MTKRRAYWLAALVVVLATVAVLVPGSPVYLPDLLAQGAQHGGHSTRYWVKALNSSDAETRHQAIIALGAIGSDASEAVPALATILTDDEDAEARHQASLALLKMVPASRAAVPALAEALADKQLIVRMNVALTLARLRTESRPAIPALIKAVKDKKNAAMVHRFHSTIQEVAVRALGRASAGSADGVPTLIATLKVAGRTPLRQFTVLALGDVGPPARPAIPLLLPLLEEDDHDLREATEEALEKIKGKPGRAS
jgi:HEAT repeat protein